MTGTPGDRGRDPLDGASRADVDARFAAIVSGLTADMSWSTSATAPDDSTATKSTGSRTGSVVGDPDPQPVTPESDAVSSDRDEAAERTRRREMRKAERAAEVAAFEAERHRAQAEIDSDDEHFVPPEPPPLPRPRRRTVVALLLMAVGVAFLVWPELVQVAPDAVMVLGSISLLGGFSLLIAGLRRRSTDPADGDGWDDGARL